MKREENEIAAVLITKHPQLGYLLVPHIVKRNNDGVNTYSLVEPITGEMINENTLQFTDDEIVALRNVLAISENSIHKLYGGRSTLRIFMNNLSPETVSTKIRPYIIRIMKSALPLIEKAGLPVFIRDNKIKVVYESDRLAISLSGNNIKLFFTLNDKGLSYKLKLTDGVDDIDLFEKRKVIVLCEEPAILIVDGRLMLFERANAARIVPFIKHKRLIVPNHLVDEYMKTYVRDCIEYYHGVRAFGFDIVNQVADCHPIIVGERVNMLWTILLKFEYDNNTFVYGDGRRKTTLTTTPNGEYIFHKFSRNYVEERRVADQLAEIGLKVENDGVVGKNLKINRLRPDDIIKILSEQRTWFDEHNIKINIKDGSIRYAVVSPDLDIQLEDNVDWFELKGTVEICGFTIPFIDFKFNIIHKRQEFRLPDGSICILPDEWFETWQEIFMVGKVKDGVMRIKRSQYGLLPDSLVMNQDQEFVQIHPSTTERQGVINGQLRDYQEVGFRRLLTWYENNCGGILADDMGLGKTLQMITLLSHVYAKDSENAAGKNTTGLRASLVAMPVSLMGNWTNELKRFAPHLAVCNYTQHRLDEKSSGSDVFDDYHVVLTSYGLLRNDIQLLSKYNFCCLIMDESQAAKNPHSLIFRALSTIIADHRFTMSGTPVENHLMDLWAQMSLVNPGMLGAQTFFHNFFERPITVYYNEQRKKRLQQLVAPYVLRRTKEEVLTELSELTVQEIRCKMPETHKRFYDRIRTSCRNMLINSLYGGNTKRFMALQAIMRLRLAANHPQLIDQQYEV